MPSYLDFDPEPDLNTADPPVGAPEGGYKGSVINNTFRYLMAVVRLLGDAVPKLGSGMAADSEIGALALKDTVAAGDIDSGAVTEAKIGALAVTEAKLASSAVTAGKLASGAVTEAKIGALQVTTAKLGEEAVTAAKILDGTVSTVKLNSSALASVAKGWVKFDVNGSIQASHNVSSVSGSDGDYTVNWNTDFADQHYAVVAMVLQNGTAGAVRSAEARAQAAGTTRIQILNGSGVVSFGGVLSVYVIAFGSQ